MHYICSLKDRGVRHTVWMLQQRWHRFRLLIARYKVTLHKQCGLLKMLVCITVSEINRS